MAKKRLNSDPRKSRGRPRKDSPPNTGDSTQNIRVEISRYKTLLDALSDPKKVARVIFTVFSLGVLLFFGITLVVVTVKRFYPYSDITTNALGTTTIKNENKEVSYWLLNTAELWADSGITVKKGQTITVKASGKKHTAVHHLYKDADENSPKLREPWVGTKGFNSLEDKRDERDMARARYKLYPGANQDALIMQIVYGDGPDNRPDDIVVTDNKTGKNITGLRKTDNRFILIGDRQENIYIEKDGRLYFTINDIPLDDATILKMMCEICDTLPLADNSESLLKLLQKADSLRTEYDKSKAEGKDIKSALDSLYNSFKGLFGYRDKELPKIDSSKYGAFEFGDNPYKQIELYGYYMEKYIAPWYEDNVGSFLIVIETTTN
ncbi:MAG: hypothetical protein Q4B16_07420 [Bacteroidia bacterium]|nr:hypothetical protein [Bacteroidia bacterium]